MIISGTGTQPASTYITHKGGPGTIALTEIVAGMNLPFVDADNKGTNPGSVGGWNSATVVFENSYSSGQTWGEMSLGGSALVFEEGVTEAANFSSSACIIRAVITGTTSGIGLELSINGN